MRGSDFAELRAFAIVEHGGFARAAAHLGCPLRRSAKRCATGGTSGCAFTESYPAAAWR